MNHPNPPSAASAISAHDDAPAGYMRNVVESVKVVAA